MAEISYRRHRFPPVIIQHVVAGSTSPMRPSGIIAASALITEFARDSLLEGARFEPSVPGVMEGDSGRLVAALIAVLELAGTAVAKAAAQILTPCVRAKGASGTTSGLRKRVFRKDRLDSFELGGCWQRECPQAYRWGVTNPAGNCPSTPQKRTAKNHAVDLILTSASKKITG
jgi:hypothetical protein